MRGSISYEAARVGISTPCRNDDCASRAHVPVAKNCKQKSRLFVFLQLVRLLLLIDKSSKSSCKATITVYLKGEAIMATATAARAETRTDDEIQRDVLEELKWDTRVQSTEIGVGVKDGIVTLTGRVGSYTKKWAAEDAAHRVRGVKAGSQRNRGLAARGRPAH